MAPLLVPNETSHLVDFPEGNNYVDMTTTTKTESCPIIADTKDNAIISRRRNTIKLLPLVALIFYNVSGGPFGLEESVRSAGPFFTLLGFVIFPFIWSFQEGLVTAELSAAYPHASGGVVWVEEAFGSLAGYMAGYLSWVAGVTDTAIYPVLFLEYFLQILPDDSGDEIDPVFRFILLASTSIGLTYINWLGLELVGSMSLTICAISMSPFIILTIFGAPKVEPHRWLVMPTVPSPPDHLLLSTTESSHAASSFFTLFTNGLRGVLWRPFLNNLFWNLNSFDSSACFAEEVDNPGKMFPRAMFWGVVFVALGYIIPLLILLGATDTKQDEWVDGYIGVVASNIVSPFLGVWIVFAAGISNLALFQAELSSDAFMLMGMSNKGYVPKMFGNKNEHGVPANALILGTIICVAMGAFKLDTIIEMLNFNYALSLLMEYAAFLKLRISKPNVHRPFRIPLGTKGCMMALFPAVLMTVVVLFLATKETWLVSLIAIGVGLFIYMLYTGKKCNYYNNSQTQTDDEVNNETTSNNSALPV